MTTEKQPQAKADNSQIYNAQVNIIAASINIGQLKTVRHCISLAVQHGFDLKLAAQLYK